MRRLFSNPVTALVAGAWLRLFFVLKFPAGSGDTSLYEQLAFNWHTFGKYALTIDGQLVTVDVRVPGYPAFLALLYTLVGRTGESARLFVMLAQICVDLGTCVLIGALAAMLSILCAEHVKPRRAFLAGLWISALCPLTANYTAVPLTEVWAVFFAALSFLILVVVATRATGRIFATRVWRDLPNKSFWMLSALGGFAVGLGTLFRPETPLLLLTTFVLLGFWMWRRREPGRWLVTCTLMTLTCAIPLLPWIIRNAVTLHEFQPLAPKDANLPNESIPRGFMAWEKTWLYRVRDCYLVSWKLNEETIDMDDIPSAAFDTPEERQQVAALLQTYNDDLTLTPEEDAQFAQLARGRTARHPLRTYVAIPLKRGVRLWFTPRIELVPVSGNVFPLAYMNEEDPADQRVTVFYFLLNFFFVVLALGGAWTLWKCVNARPAILILVLYILVRTAFLTTLETPEPRYTLVCFPALLALGAQVFTAKSDSQVL
jgi:4-amino-4-deoxy-L-arabinose transferase-like glycosyltransferase